jgi:TonB family protein
MAPDLSSSPPPDLTRVFEDHLASAFPPDVAFDLVLSELVGRAVDATLASAGALALLEGDEMVCRAATGALSHCLGAHLSTRRGLFGICARTGTAQSCRDAESDPRMDPEDLRGLGIRSLLVVPVFEGLAANHENSDSPLASDNPPQVVGVLEMCSPVPDAFLQGSQATLEAFAWEVARVRRMASQLDSQGQAPALVRTEVRPPVRTGVRAEAKTNVRPERELLHSFDSITNEARADAGEDVPAGPLPYRAWTLVLCGMVFVAALGLSFLVGTRVGLVGHHPRHTPNVAESSDLPDTTAAAAASNVPEPAPTAPPSTNRARTKTKRDADSGSSSGSSSGSRSKTKSQSGSSDSAAAPSSDLVVYEKGKVIFRMKSPPASSGTAGSATTDSAEPAGSGDNAAPATGENMAQASAGQPSAGQASPDKVAQAQAPAQRDVSRSGSGGAPASSNSHATGSRRAWLSAQDAQSRLITHPQPAYPADALAAGRTGDVVLDIRVAENGSVNWTRVVSGDPMLSAAAVEAVRGWHYQPYVSNGRPASFETIVTVPFSLPQ